MKNHVLYSVGADGSRRALHSAEDSAANTALYFSAAAQEAIRAARNAGEPLPCFVAVLEHRESGPEAPRRSGSNALRKASFTPVDVLTLKPLGEPSPDLESLFPKKGA